MAGLLLKELLIRGELERCLIVEARDDTEQHIPLPPELRHRRMVVTMEPADHAVSPSSSPNRDPEHMMRVLAEAWGAWGRMSADEIDQMIEDSRPSSARRCGLPGDHAS